jgi:NADH dehydrogenase
VRPDLTLPGHPEILVIGDMAHIEQDGKLVPGVAPAAMQMGTYAAELLRLRARGTTPAPFRYVDKGSMATLGRHSAIADIRGMRFSGLPAWLFWLGLHIFFLIGFRNRVLVLLEWAFSYFTFNRGARLITGETPSPPELRED